MRALVIGYVWPEPASSAAGTRMLELVQLLLKMDYQVTFASAAALSEHRFDLNSLGVTEKSIALNCSSFDDFVRELNPNLVLFDRFFTEEQFGWRVEPACPDAACARYRRSSQPAPRAPTIIKICAETLGQ